MRYLSWLKQIFKERRDLFVIRHSPLFDATWYARKYPDVIASGMSPAVHYLRHGGFEGRNPSPRFYSDEYLAMYDDVRRARQNPLLHYELCGRAEGRPISSAHFRLSRMPFAAIRNRMRVNAEARIIRKSAFFDGKWYLRNNPDVAAARMDPATHYLLHGVESNRNPSPDFCNEEYLTLHSDVRAAGINPLLHYERYGKREGRAVSLLELKEPSFPETAIEGEWRFGDAPRVHGRTALVASYFGGGTLPDTLLYLLRGLREVADNVVYVADCRILPEEVERLRGLVSVAKVERHRQYDFGSYRRALALARRLGYLKEEVADELIVINDSNYGPVVPFAESFEAMAGRPCDFWGYTGYHAFGHRHISSYFYLFRRKVIDSLLLDVFLDNVQGTLERDKVIVKFEFRLTRFLESEGFAWDTFVPMGLVRGAPTKYPLRLLETYRMPLLKAKAINGDSYDDGEKALALARALNPELGAMIVRRPIAAEHPKLNLAEHQAAFPGKCRTLAERLARGEPARAVFFVSSPSMFPARPLFDAMRTHPLFAPTVCVIPDLRWRGTDPGPAMEACARELREAYPEDLVRKVTVDEFGAWPEVLLGADIVCYPSPYELSSFRYNPRYAVGRDFLPICANYGFYRSVYDREVMGNQCYAYLWKAFFECEETLREYAAHSVLKGTNADLVGYIKMDALAWAMAAARPHARKRVLIAPHHSVEGGTNQMLALANFVGYADFFGALPDRYPEIDFVFRPHPFLFTVLSRPNQWGPERVAAYVAALKAKPNVVWCDAGDYFPAFAEADACVQDCGSWLVEWLYTGKPCCYMLKSPDDIGEKFAPLGQQCLGHCTLAYDEATIDAFIREVVIGGNDPKAEARKAFAQTIMVNWPHAADVALEHILASIRQPEAGTAGQRKENEA